MPFYKTIRRDVLLLFIIVFINVWFSLQTERYLILRDEQRNLQPFRYRILEIESSFGQHIKRGKCKEKYIEVICIIQYVTA